MDGWMVGWMDGWMDVWMNLCEASAVHKISDCQPGGPRFNLLPDRRSNFGRLSLPHRLWTGTLSRWSSLWTCYPREIKRTHSVLERRRVVIPVLWWAHIELTVLHKVLIY